MPITENAGNGDVDETIGCCHMSAHAQSWVLCCVMFEWVRGADIWGQDETENDAHDNTARVHS